MYWSYITDTIQNELQNKGKYINTLSIRIYCYELQHKTSILDTMGITNIYSGYMISMNWKKKKTKPESQRVSRIRGRFVVDFVIDCLVFVEHGHEHGDLLLQHRVLSLHLRPLAPLLKQLLLQMLEGSRILLQLLVQPVDLPVLFQPSRWFYQKTV